VTVADYTGHRQTVFPVGEINPQSMHLMILKQTSVETGDGNGSMLIPFRHVLLTAIATLAVTNVRLILSRVFVRACNVGVIVAKRLIGSNCFFFVRGLLATEDSHFVI